MNEKLIEQKLVRGLWNIPQNFVLDPVRLFLVLLLRIYICIRICICTFLRIIERPKKEIQLQLLMWPAGVRLLRQMWPSSALANRRRMLRKEKSALGQAFVHGSRRSRRHFPGELKACFATYGDTRFAPRNWHTGLSRRRPSRRIWRLAGELCLDRPEPTALSPGAS